MAESKLAKFVEDIIVPPKMIDVIVDGEVFCLSRFFYFFSNAIKELLIWFIWGYMLPLCAIAEHGILTSFWLNFHLVLTP